MSELPHIKTNRISFFFLPADKNIENTIEGQLPDNVAYDGRLCSWHFGSAV